MKLGSKFEEENVEEGENVNFYGENWQKKQIPMNQSELGKMPPGPITIIRRQNASVKIYP